jgi:zinc D-Ala-D-Ala carboxypeptidase
MTDLKYRLTTNFVLGEFLLTDHLEFQALNQQVSSDQIGKLHQVALLEELVRTELGCMLHNHSGYRCPGLNTAVGSSDRSQHLLCEAVDFDRYGFSYTAETLKTDFDKIAAAARAGRLKFGQLIMESAKRYTNTGTTVSMWLHISLGAPWRPAERCGQLLSMVNGVYTSLGVV